jgi:predicted HNH restriction endonuclease
MAGLYSTAPWRRARAQALHDAGYRCARCDVYLLELGPKQAHVHHRKPLKRAPVLGLEPLNLQPLCRQCHTIVHDDEKHLGFARGVDINGFPLAPEHPWNLAGGI